MAVIGRMAGKGEMPLLRSPSSVGRAGSLAWVVCLSGCQSSPTRTGRTRTAVKSILELTLKRLDLFGKGTVIAGQRFDLAHRVQHGCVIAAAKAAADLRQ